MNERGSDAPVSRGRKHGQSVRGAPFPPGRGQHEGPERPTRQVPSAPEQPEQPDQPAEHSEQGSPPTAVDEENDNGTRDGTGARRA
jgi:hypothetical protein